MITSLSFGSPDLVFELLRAVPRCAALSTQNQWVSTVVSVVTKLRGKDTTQVGYVGSVRSEKLTTVINAVEETANEGRADGTNGATQFHRNCTKQTEVNTIKITTKKQSKPFSPQGECNNLTAGCMPV